ncbi:MAG TPA: Gfo/Idh/MocA family oxidoreductase [Flavilitoribacter sp.]|nr:Gfo/Idh/MocA family oxidoreductase [Flavilitoribacter sp.]
MATRRTFIGQTSKAAAGILLLPALDIQPFSILRGGIPPSDTIHVGAIGINGMGGANVKSAVRVPGVQLTALCDVDQRVLDRRMGELTGMGIDGAKVETFRDYRKMLEKKDLDVVIVGTPDHWHALIMIHACEAGKDVYVEKPIANSIGETDLMLAAEKRYNRVVQVGQWQRSQQHFRDAIEFVHSGRLGNIRTVKAWAYQGWMKPAPVVPDSAPPAEVDYDMWLGPAPKRPFNESRFHFNFRWFWDYAGGLMTDWGVHMVDYALFGMKAGMPKTAAALGGKFAYPELSHETPDSQTTIYEFSNFILIWEHALAIDLGPYRKTQGVAFVGNNGTLVVNRQGWEVIEEEGSKSKVAVPWQDATPDPVLRHWENFISVVRSRKTEELNASLSVGAHVAKVCQIGNIAYRSGKKLDWDAANNRFTDKKVNKQYLQAKYHNGYSLPKV